MSNDSVNESREPLLDDITESEAYESFAQIAYEAYGEVTDHKNFQGFPMPTWEQLPTKIKEAWIASVKATTRRIIDFGYYKVL